MALQLRLLAAGTALGAWLGVATAPAGAQEIKARSGSTVTVGGRVQVQYEASSADSVSSFSVRRVWVTIDGRVSDRVGGRIQFNADGPNADGKSVFDAYLEVKHSDGLKLQFGRFKRAMSYFWLAANADLPMIERNAKVSGVKHCPGVEGVCSYGQLTGALGLDTYETGVLATGRSGSIGYRATLTNGESRRDVNSRKSLSSRVSYYPQQKVRLSAYLALDEIHREGKTMGVPAFGGELEVGSWRDGFHLLATGTTGRNWKVDDDASFTAFQLMALWYRPLESPSLAGVEPMLRVSWVSTERPGIVPLDRGGGDGSHANYSGDVTGTVITPGFMVYFAGRNGISANVDYYTSDDLGEAGDSEWSLKLQAFAFF